MEVFPRQTLLSQRIPKAKGSSRRLYIEWRVAELLSSLFSCFGILSSTADYEYGFSPDRDHANCLQNVNQVYRWLTLILTIVSIYFLVLRHYIKSKWNNKRIINSSIHPKKIIKKNKKILSKNLIVEIFLLLIFPYPYFEGNITIPQPIIYEMDSVELCYNLSEILYVIMFIRLLFLFKSLFNFTPYQDDHARYYCSKNETKANVRFSIRCMMKTHPFVIIYCFSFPSFFLLGAFLRVFERPYSDTSKLNFASYQNAVWNCAVTMATVGYGDLYPSTLPGRIVGVLCAMWGAFVFSMIVFTLHSLLELDHQQTDAFFSIKKTRGACRVISASLLYNVIKNKHGKNSAEAKKQMRVVQKKLKRFKSTLKNLKKIDLETEESPLNKIQILSKQISVLEEKIDYLISNK